MLARIPDDKVEEIRNSNDIVEVISDYVQLKKQGKNYIGLCPFHGEKTPSFSVSPDKQLYHCFGCGAGGNVFSFVMEMDGFSFVEAVVHLGKRAHIELPNIEVTKPKEQMKQNVLLEGHELASKYYQYILGETEFGQLARQYLEGRGFTKELTETFQIGYAQDTWDGLTNVLIKRNYDLKTMEHSGLLGVREFDGKVFDRFRDRIMFPIWDGQGQIIAFGGRTLGEDQPKYLNSPETKLFSKGKTIYGLHLARPQIRKENETVLFEGYVDVISAWQAGITNGVATLGTALTEEQAKIIRRNSEKVIICYDSDEAGVNAAYRAVSMFDKVGCFIKVAMLPEGYDPDDYIQKYGSEAFLNKIIRQSLTLMAFKMRYLRRGKNLQDEGERIRYIEEVLKEISLLSKPVERDHYLRQMATEFSLSLDALKQEQSKMYRRQKKANSHPYEGNNHTDKKQVFIQPKRLLPAYQNAERILLSYMMKDEAICEKVKQEIGGAFNIDEYQAIAAYLYAYYNEGYAPDTAHFINWIQDNGLQKIAAEIAMMQLKEDLTEQELFDYIKKIELYPRWVEVEEKEKEKQEAVQQKDSIRAAGIAMEIIQLKKMLNNSL
jgi:DNA primase